MEITKTTIYLGIGEYRFNKVFAEAVEYVSQENIGKQSYYNYPGKHDRDYLFDELYNFSFFDNGSGSLQFIS
uniref:hypothetical protein n=1 Tax=Agathobacter sp. TaxID=2021311 RepID=UPI004055D4DC